MCVLINNFTHILKSLGKEYKLNNILSFPLPKNIIQIFQAHMKSKVFLSNKKHIHEFIDIT